MIKIIYKVDTPERFSLTERKIFLNLLEQQGKITNPVIEKINRCTFLCVCKVDNSIVSIGAIKPKTNSDFNSEKSDLNKLQNEFQLELGYCFTLPKHIKNGYSSSIVKLLLEKTANKNLMASTELRTDNSMKRILERNGFNQFGKPWKSKRGTAAITAIIAKRE